MSELNGRSGGENWTTFVLIPGAGADPRVYAATIAALHDLGHEGIAPPLPLDDPKQVRALTPTRWSRASPIRAPSRW